MSFLNQISDSDLMIVALSLCAAGVLMIGYAYRMFLNWWREN